MHFFIRFAAAFYFTHTAAATIQTAHAAVISE